MKKYRLPLLITLLILIFAGILLFTNRTGTLRNKSNTFAVSDTSNITRLFFSDKRNNTVELERNTDGTWKLNDKYLASPDLVNTMMRTLISVDIKAPVARIARNNIIRLMAAKSVKVEVYQQVYRIRLGDKIRLFPHEKLTKTYYVGDATQDNMGTYMLMEGSEEPYVVVIPGFRGFVSARYSAKEADWRSHGIFNSKLPEIKKITVEYTETPENSFAVTNAGNRLFDLVALQGSKPLTGFDTMKVINYLGSYRKINFEAVLSDLSQHEYDSITASGTVFKITLEKTDGSKQVLEAWRRKAAPGETDFEGNPIEWDRDRMFARIEGTKELVIIQYFVFDAILRPLSWFTSPPETKTGY